MESGMVAFRIRFTATATPLAPPPTIALDTAFAPKPAPISDIGRFSLEIYSSFRH
jgi:hypothetical protein